MNERPILPQETDCLMTLKQAAARCGCSTKTFRERLLPIVAAIDLARPEATRRRWRFRPASLDEALSKIERRVA